MTKPSSVPYLFKLTLLECGQWKPAKFVPLDDYSVVCVDVPLQKEYIANIEPYILKQLDADKLNPILTVSGVEYVFKQLNKAFQPDEVKPEDFKSEDKPVEVDGWDE
jgi:hypothetical protein